MTGRWLLSRGCRRGKLARSEGRARMLCEREPIVEPLLERLAHVLSDGLLAGHLARAPLDHADKPHGRPRSPGPELGGGARVHLERAEADERNQERTGAAVERATLRRTPAGLGETSNRLRTRRYARGVTRAELIDQLPRPIQRALRGTKREARALLLAGRSVECPICHGSFRRFATIPGDRQILCPRCLSLDRHRRNALFLRRETNIFDARLRVLHIAPEPSLRRELERLPNLDYVTADLCGDDVSVEMDVTAIPFPEESFDVILCSHVLEHVVDDRRAMHELRRVLKRDGWALINVPSEPGRAEIYEDDSVIEPGDRLVQYGQEDHVRIYSTGGFVERLREAGFEVEIDPLTFSSEERKRYVLEGDGGWDHAYFCRRRSTPAVSA
jgi:SAM-dependent methyltransferase